MVIEAVPMKRGDSVPNHPDLSSLLHKLASDFFVSDIAVPNCSRVPSSSNLQLFNMASFRVVSPECTPSVQTIRLKNSMLLTSECVFG
ncbi:hypothetical protein L1987_60435 [Smallanthus sonchifolius]|uniref:Uncharacterized protein n=1 Tax=Smallanthus sonchifolius TaxID=185202 RepID=A0ACB9D8A4_9ASTR|nr:hypothetical protein L1987_60435 [Smallanthus sonchifolius]